MRTPATPKKTAIISGTKSGSSSEGEEHAEVVAEKVKNLSFNKKKVRIQEAAKRINSIMTFDGADSARNEFATEIETRTRQIYESIQELTDEKVLINLAESEIFENVEKKFQETAGKKWLNDWKRKNSIEDRTVDNLVNDLRNEGRSVLEIEEAAVKCFFTRQEPNERVEDFEKRFREAQRESEQSMSEAVMILGFKSAGLRREIKLKLKISGSFWVKGSEQMDEDEAEIEWQRIFEAAKDAELLISVEKAAKASGAKKERETEVLAATLAKDQPKGSPDQNSIGQQRSDIIDRYSQRKTSREGRSLSRKLNALTVTRLDTSQKHAPLKPKETTYRNLLLVGSRFG